MPIKHQPTVHYPISLLEVGDSFFVPCLSAGAHIHQLRKIAAELEFTIDYRMGIDTATGLYGIRVLRTA
jgi:hypothetical protein